MLNFIRQGAGPPLLLVHGLGGSWRSWTTILPALSEAREVVALDLPGHCQTPAVADSGTVRAFADSVDAFITEQGLYGIDIVGRSLGARTIRQLSPRSIPE